METNRNDLFDTEFLERLRHLSLKLRRRRSLNRQGSELAGAAGATREFRDFRSYAPMDDVRSIDWGVYARLEKLVIRLYEDLQEVPVTVVIDASRSMAHPHPEKRRLALQIAVALAYLGALNQHRVSVFSMSDGLTPVMAPFKNGAAVHHLIESLMTLPFEGQTDFQGSVNRLKRVGSRPGLVFVLSDFLGRDRSDCPRAFARCQRWQSEGHLLRIYDPEEARPTLRGNFELEDSETGVTEQVVWSKEREENYVKAFEDYGRDLARVGQQARLTYFPWATDRPFDVGLAQWLSGGTGPLKTT